MPKLIQIVISCHALRMFVCSVFLYTSVMEELQVRCLGRADAGSEGEMISCVCVCIENVVSMLTFAFEVHGDIFKTST